MKQKGGLVYVSFLVVFFFISCNALGYRMENSTSIINPMPYADCARTSYLPVKGRLSGEDVWSSSSTELQVSLPPLWLAIREHMLLVGYNNEIIALNVETGKSIWRVPIKRQFNFLCNEEGVLIDRFTKWRPFDTNEIISHHISKPDNSFITSYFQDDEWLWYGFYTTKLPTRRGKKQNYWYQFNRHRNGNSGFEWSYRVDGRSLGSLCTVDGGIFWIVMSDQVRFFSPENAYDSSVQTISAPGIISFACDHYGNLLLVTYEEEAFYLKQYSLSREEDWKVLLSNVSRTMQPPASSPKGMIYVGDKTGVAAIENGEEKWRVELSNGATAVHTTVLADNSILVASVNVLHAINSDGEEYSSKILPCVITCRPIMDAKGRIFAAGKEGVYCVK